MTFASPRRWLRFNLRTMFVLVTTVALWLGWELSIVVRRRTAIAELPSDQAAQVFTVADYDDTHETHENAATISLLRRLLGDQPVELIRYPSGRNESEKHRLKALFPEADVGEL